MTVDEVNEHDVIDYVDNLDETQDVYLSYRQQ